MWKWGVWVHFRDADWVDARVGLGLCWACIQIVGGDLLICICIDMYVHVCACMYVDGVFLLEILLMPANG